MKPALPKLESKYINWIFTEAGAAFDKHLAEAEAELMRHEHFKDEPLVTSLLVVKTREEKIASLRRYIEDYRRVAEYCRVMRELADQMDMPVWKL